MNLLLLEDHDFEGERVRLRGPRHTHLHTVLCAKEGSTVRAGRVDGEVGTLRILAIDDGETRGIFEALEALPERPRVDLVLCLPRPKVLARLLPSIAQLGVGRVMLSGAHRVERFYFDAHVLEPDKLRALLLEGLTQARDTRLPQVTVHRSFAWLLRTELDPLVGPSSLRIYAEPGEQRSVREALAHVPSDTRVVVAIGPEGGFTEREQRELEQAGFTRVGMRARTLKSEVATIALLALVHDALE